MSRSLQCNKQKVPFFCIVITTHTTYKRTFRLSDTRQKGGCCSDPTSGVFCEAKVFWQAYNSGYAGIYYLMNPSGSRTSNLYACLYGAPGDRNRSKVHREAKVRATSQANTPNSKPSAS